MSHLFNTNLSETNPMNTKNDQAQVVRIEPITPEQYLAAAELMAYGFGQKFQKSSSLSVTELASVFEHLLISPHQIGGLRVVALKNDVVIGTMALKWKGSENVKKANPVQTKWWRMQRHIGYWKLLRIMMRIQLLKHEPEAGECYIEDIVVHPDHQGKGVGRHLLAWAQQYLLQTAQLSYLSLHVAHQNRKAMQMYEHDHFRNQSSTNSLLTGLLIGEHQWSYMTRKGDNKDEKEQVQT